MEMVIRHGMDVGGVAGRMKEELLTRGSPLSEGEMLAVAEMVAVIQVPTPELVQLSTLVFEAIEESLPKAAPSFISRVIQVLSRSTIPIPHSLSTSLNSHLTPSLHRFAYNNMVALTHLMRPNPLPFLYRLGLLQIQPI